MSRNGRVMKHYSPTGRRNHGKPLKRLLDTWDRNESTSGPTPWQIDDDKNGYKWGTSGWHEIPCKCCPVFRERHLTACPVGAVSTATVCKERSEVVRTQNRLLFISWHWRDNRLQNHRAPVYISGINQHATNRLMLNRITILTGRARSAKTVDAF
jgi:hypothetical protein